MSSPLADPSLFGESSSVEGTGEERLVLRDILASFEKSLIVTVLLAAGGNQKRAAEALGVLPTTFQEKLKRFGLLNQRFGRGARGGERASGRNDSNQPHDEAHQTPRERTQQ